LCTKRDTLKEKSKRIKVKTLTSNLATSKTVSESSVRSARVSESSVRSAKPETLKPSSLPELENEEIKFLKKNKEDGGDWLLQGTSGKAKPVEG